MKKIYTLSLVLLVSISSFGQVVISQVYGGGGNSGAQFTNDFIELFNRGTTAQSLNGWSVQYASSTGPTTSPNLSWLTTVLPNVTIQPGKYFLIQQAAGATASTALPTPDFNGVCATCTTDGNGTTLLTTGIAMSSSNGKVILVNVVTPQTGTNPTGAQIIDKVGYGTTPNGFEGAGPTAVQLTNSTAALRKLNGCTDTNSNLNDFDAVAPNPRNSATVANLCAPASVNQNSISGLSIYPNPAKGGVLYIDTQANSEKSVAVFDVLGKQVLNVTTSSNNVNVSRLVDGVYIVKITENGNTATRKLVINN